MALTNLPIGTIIAWENDTIPSGWAICDGNNGTPNLVDKFIFGASVDDDIRDTGGTLTHLHTNSSTDIRLNHNHGGTKNFEVGGSNDVATTDGTGFTAVPDVHGHDGNVVIYGADSHSHTIGNTLGASSLPPYILRVFIRRIS